MKRIRYLFIIAVVLLLPLVHVSESYAIDEGLIRNVVSLEYRLNGSTNTTVTINNSQTLIYQPSTITGGKVTLNRFKVNFNDTIGTGNGRFFRHIFQITIVRSADSDMPTVNCPQSDWERHDYIRDCQIFSHTTSYEPGSINPTYPPSTTIGSSTNLEFNGGYVDSYIMQVDIGNRQDLGTTYRILNGVIVTAPQSSLVYYAPLQTMSYRDDVSLETEAIQEQTEKVQEQIDKDEQDRDNMESQQSDVSDDSDDSQAQAESTGQTLLTAFTGFVSAITSARPTNCNLNMDMGNLNLGNVNLCQLSPPPVFQTIASIFMIAFCVPLSITTARKLINLFRSFQG